MAQRCLSAATKLNIEYRARSDEGKKGRKVSNWARIRRHPAHELQIQSTVPASHHSAAVFHSSFITPCSIFDIPSSRRKHCKAIQSPPYSPHARKIPHKRRGSLRERLIHHVDAAKPQSCAAFRPRIFSRSSGVKKGISLRMRSISLSRGGRLYAVRTAPG